MLGSRATQRTVHAVSVRPIEPLLAPSSAEHPEHIERLLRDAMAALVRR
jgi:hypothetical protein